MGPTTEPTMHKRHKDNSEAVEAFVAKKAEIDTMLARLTAPATLVRAT